MEYKIKELNISDIKPDKDQPRKTFDEEQLQHLAESILSNGLLNPIEVDEDYIITDGERRWRACKLAKLKIITCRIVSNKDKTDKLRRQLIFSLQDEEIPTEEKYEAIVKLWKMEKKVAATLTMLDYSKKLGVSESMIHQAFDYCDFAEEEPELAKQVSPRVIADTKGLPKEERMELIKEFKNIPKEDKKSDLMRELVREKKQEIAERKEIEKLRKEKSAKEVKIITDRDKAWQILDDIKKAQGEFQKLMVNINWMRKKKFYFMKAKDKDNFFKFLEGTSERARRWADELDELRDNIELEILEE